MVQKETIESKCNQVCCNYYNTFQKKNPQYKNVSNINKKWSENGVTMKRYDDILKVSMKNKETKKKKCSKNELLEKVVFYDHIADHRR